MDIKREKLPQAQVKLTITLAPAEFEHYLAEVRKEFARETKIKGFRPGKAPARVVEEKFGAGQILQEAADLAVRGTYLDALRQEKLEPLGRPEIKVSKLAPGNDFVYEAQISVLPEVRLPDYQKIAAKILGQADKSKIEVSEKEVASALAWLAESRCQLITANRRAQKGDRVEIDFTVSQKGVPIKSGQSKNHPLILGENKFAPGFEEQLIGLVAGAEKEFSLTFPPDYHAKHLAGQAADFKVKLNLVQEKQKPEINDAFACSLGQFKKLADLRQSIKEGIAQEKEQKRKEQQRLEIISTIADQAKIELPAALVDGELEKMLAEFKVQVAQMGMEWDKYLGSIKKTVADLRQEWHKKAEQRVRVGLVLRQIAAAEKIEPTETEVEAEANKALRAFRAADQAQNKIDSQRLREYTKGVLTNEKIFQFLENASTKKSKSKVK